MTRLVALVETLAARRSSDLPPGWASDPSLAEAGGDTIADLAALCRTLGWRPPARLSGSPRAGQFPLLTFAPGSGWAVAEQWESLDHVAVTAPGETVRQVTPETSFFDVQLPTRTASTSDRRAISVFWRALLLRKGVFAASIVATVTVNLLAFVTSLYSMQVYDRVIPRGGFATLWVLTLGVAIALLLDFALRTIRSLLVEREAAQIDAEVSEFFFSRALSLRLDSRPSGVGSLAAQIRGWEQIRALLSSAFVFLLADLPFALLFVLGISWLGGSLALVPLLAAGLALGFGLLIARLIRADSARAQVSGNKKNGLLVEMLDAAEVIKANRGSWQVLGRWNRLMDQLQLHEDPVKKWSALASSTFGMLQQLTYIIVVAWGAYRVAEGEMTTGTLVACTILAGRVNGPLITQLPNFLVQWSYARSSLAMLDSLMALPVDHPPDIQSLRPDQLEPSLRLESLTFAYPSSRLGIEIEKLDIRAGEKVAIIGSVGAGKSTLLRLMAGIYAPASGSTTIGNVELWQIAPDVLRRHLGYLPQDSRLLNGTLRDNLMLGLANPGDQALLGALEELGFSAFIASHPRGVDLPIEEGGRGLSGGQRTLAHLARLFLSETSCWILDEPTASLDPATEARVIAALKKRLDSRRTLVLATHRTQLLALCERTIVLSAGKIVLDGPTAQVMTALRDAPADPPAAAAAATPAS